MNLILLRGKSYNQPNSTTTHSHSSSIVHKPSERSTSNSNKRLNWSRWFFIRPFNICSSSFSNPSTNKQTYKDRENANMMIMKQDTTGKASTTTPTTSPTITSNINGTSVSFLRLARERRFDEIVETLVCLQNHCHEDSCNDFKSSTSTASSTSSSSMSGAAASPPPHSSSTSSSSRLYEWLQVHSENRSSTSECLHVLCMYRPTPKVVQMVQKMIEQQAHHYNNHCYKARTTNSSSDDEPTKSAMARTTSYSDMMIVNATLVTDSMGRTPLHIAVACGCSYSVIDVLLCEDHEAVYMMDRTNRYPLHWACCCVQSQPTNSTTSHVENGITSNVANQQSEKDIVNTIKVINKLMCIYAMAVISKDDTGCTPMDLAIANHADRRIIYALQYIPTPTSNIRESPRRRFIGTTDDKNDIDSKSCSSSQYPNGNAPVRYIDPNDIDSDMDDVSSIGSRGVSKSRRRNNRKHKHEYVQI